MYKPGILMYREAPIQSLFQLDLFEEKINALVSGLDSYVMVVDLTGAKAPSAEIRARLRQLLAAQTKLRKIAVFTGRNFMLNIAAKFVLSGAGLHHFSVHTTLEQALRALEP